MPSTGPSFFILGVLVASVRADNSTSLPVNSSISDNMTVTPSWDGNSSSTAAEGKGGGNQPEGALGDETTVDLISTTMLPTSTFKPSNPPATTTSNSRGRALTKDPKQPDGPVSHSDDSTGIIILVVIIVVALGFGVACYCARKRGQHYSVDFNSRADGANIPLSTVEPEMTAEAGTQNGLKTFETADVSTKEAVAEAKDEEQVEKKGEADNTAADPSAESAAPAKPPDSVEVEPKGDVIEPTPPASVELSMEEMTDEGVDSNKTSVESLREANENNSNNAGPRQQRDVFWDIPLSAAV